MLPPESMSARRPPVAPSDNELDVYTALAHGGPSSRVNLARELALSQTSVSRIVDRLVRTGLVREGERVSVGTGRPQTLLHQNASAALVAAVSVRSRFVRVHLADLRGHVHHRIRRDRTDVSAVALTEQIVRLVEEARGRSSVHAPLAAVTVGLSGVWNEAAREVRAAPNLRLLEGCDLHDLLRRQLADLNLSPALAVDNDVNLAALGERAHGAAQGIEDFFYLNLGSGVGGAAVVRGEVQRGAHGFGGELGYLPVCVDGSVHTLEELLGRRALLAHARKQGLGPGDEDALELLDDDAAGSGVLAAYVSRILGQALVAVATTLDPRLIVIGGGVGSHVSSLTGRIRTTLASFVPLVPEVVPTAIGPEASLLGAVDHARDAARMVVLTRALHDA